MKGYIKFTHLLLLIGLSWSCGSIAFYASYNSFNPKNYGAIGKGIENKIIASDITSNKK
jgi:hypothetical protein